MKQRTFATAADHGAGFERYRREIKRDVFLATMNEIVPWQALCEVIEPRATRSAATVARRPAWSACLRAERYRSLAAGWQGLAKNTAHMVTRFAWLNPWMALKKLMAMTGVVRPQTA